MSSLPGPRLTPQLRWKLLRALDPEQRFDALHGAAKVLQGPLNPASLLSVCQPHVELRIVAVVEEQHPREPNVGVRHRPSVTAIAAACKGAATTGPFAQAPSENWQSYGARMGGCGSRTLVRYEHPRTDRPTSFRHSRELVKETCRRNDRARLPQSGRQDVRPQPDTHEAQRRES
jgi:hypothetical protein